MGSGLQRSLFGLGYDDVGHHFIFKKIILVLFLNFLFVNFFCFVWTFFFFFEFLSLTKILLSLYFLHNTTQTGVLVALMIADYTFINFTLSLAFSLCLIKISGSSIITKDYYIPRPSLSLSLSKYQKAICFDGLWIRKLEVFIMTKLALFLVHVIPRYGLF